MTILSAVQQQNRELEAALSRVGPHVFRLELALGSTERARRKAARARGERPAMRPWAPTLNEYNGLEPWAKQQLRGAIDALILSRKAAYNAWPMGIVRKAGIVRGKPHVAVQGGRRRIVLVTRESSRRPDESSVDVLGGKMPIDRLVLADVLRGDSCEWVVRVGRWVPAQLGEGRVVVDVYEVGDERDEPTIPVMGDSIEAVNHTRHRRSAR
jgi:hypothetical protein